MRTFFATLMAMFMVIGPAHSVILSIKQCDAISITFTNGGEGQAGVFPR